DGGVAEDGKGVAAGGIADSGVGDSAASAGTLACSTASRLAGSGRGWFIYPPSVRWRAGCSKECEGLLPKMFTERPRHNRARATTILVRARLERRRRALLRCLHERGKGRV